MSETARNPRVLLFRGAVLGAVIGAVFGAWTSATARPVAEVVVPTARPSAVMECPDGYARSAQFDTSAVVDGTSAHWLARCDPRQSNAPISESLEMFWSNHALLAAGGRSAALQTFMRTVAQSSHLLLEPLHDVPNITIHGMPATVVEADGALRLPPMGARVWILPAGGSTVEVMAMATRERLSQASDAARAMIRTIEGITPFSDPPRNERSWTVSVQCPTGYADSTPSGGGVALGMYVGRYCIAPDAMGGAEIVVAELPGAARDEHGVRQVLALATQSTQSIGVSTGAGFGPTEHETLRDLDVPTAMVEIDTPSARIHLRGYLLPAGDATVYGLATTMFDHADVAKSAMETWLADHGSARAYDPSILRDYKVRRAIDTIVLPAMITSILGALVAFLIARGVLKFGE